MLKTVITLLIMTGYAVASTGSEGGGTDIFERTINFLIFAGILYYLLAEPVKGFFTGRTAEIAADLEKVQEKLRESKAAKEAALAEVEEAHKFAAELHEHAKKENNIIKDKIIQQCESDIENIIKQHESLMDLEQRKMVRNTVNDIMSELLEEDSAGFDKEMMAKIIMKKVA